MLCVLDCARFGARGLVVAVCSGGLPTPGYTPTPLRGYRYRLDCRPRRGLVNEGMRRFPRARARGYGHVIRRGGFQDDFAPSGLRMLGGGSVFPESRSGLL